MFSNEERRSSLGNSKFHFFFFNVIKFLIWRLASLHIEYLHLKDLQQQTLHMEQRRRLYSHETLLLPLGCKLKCSGWQQKANPEELCTKEPRKTGEHLYRDGAFVSPMSSLREICFLPLCGFWSLSLIPQFLQVYCESQGGCKHWNCAVLWTSTEARDRDCPISE